MSKNRILHNIRILDFTWALAGPYATRLLADFGAEVIKVQSPLMEAETDAYSLGYYTTWNRNKLGITLNLNKPEGVGLAKKLVAVSDAVIENFSPRVMANWGLDFANLKKIKPDIIIVSMSMLGQGSNYSGYGPTVHALSGMTQLTSFPGQPPLGPGFAYADHVAGLHASMKLLAALEKRSKTGKGQHIDISEVDIMKGLLQDIDEPKPIGNNLSKAAPHNVYQCKDGQWVAIAVFTEGEWRGLKKALGSPAWAVDMKFDGLSKRLENQVELDSYIAAWTKQHTAKETMSLFQKNGVAAGFVQDAADLAKDPQLKETGFIMKKNKIPFIDVSPISMPGVSVEYKPAPSPGRDNDYVYGELLGIGEKERVGLKDRRII
jgi:crotonobetainyl-CoA:carnitine CoA-transferase CaiB-like acyl-CoA transferase